MDESTQTDLEQALHRWNELEPRFRDLIVDRRSASIVLWLQKRTQGGLDELRIDDLVDECEVSEEEALQFVATLQGLELCTVDSQCFTPSEQFGDYARSRSRALSILGNLDGRLRSSNLPYSDRQIQRAWDRAEGHCDCQARGHLHAGRCGQPVLEDLRDLAVPGGWVIMNTRPGGDWEEGAQVHCSVCGQLGRSGFGGVGFA